MKILIVDDDLLVLRSVSRLLIRRGYDVQAHWRHADALGYARNWADVALVDIDMPERSGPELACMFPPSLPVVFHTGNPEAAPRGSRRIAKPARIEDIIAELEAVYAEANRKEAT